MSEKSYNVPSNLIGYNTSSSESNYRPVVSNQPEQPVRSSALCYDSEEDRRLVETSLTKLIWVIIIPIVAVIGYLIIIYAINKTIDFSNTNLLILFIIASVGLIASLIVLIIIYGNHRAIPSCSRVPIN